MSQIPSRIPTRRSLTASLNLSDPVRPTVTPMVVPNQSSVALAQALGILGAVGNLAENERRRQQEETRKREKIDTLLKADDAALGIQFANQDLARDEVNLDPLVRDWDPLTMPAEDFARQVATLRLPDTASEAQRSAYLSKFLPKFTSLLHQHAAAESNKALGEMVQLQAENFIEADTPERMNQLLAEAKADPRFQKFSDDDHLQGFILPALKSAAESGDRARFEAAAATLGDRFPAEQRRHAATLQARQREQDARTAAEMQETVWAALDRGMPYETILQAITTSRDDGSLMPGQALQLRETVINRAQHQHVTDLRTRILNGTITLAEVETAVKEASQREPDALDYIDPVTGASILNGAQRREEFNIAAAQVASVVSGQPGNLTEAQHGGAFSEIVGPQGIGLIDAQNRIADAPGLASTLVRARIIPPAIRQTIVANLTSPATDDVAAASRVVGQVSTGNPRLYAALLEAASDSEKASIIAAATAYERGRLEGDTATTEIQRIRDAKSAAQEIPPVTPELRSDIERHTNRFGHPIAIEDRVSGVLARVREDYPHTKDFGLFGFDFLAWDPGLDMADNNVQRRMERWFTDHFLIARTLMSQEQALERSEKHVRAQVRRNVDFVRWNDRVTPVLIDTGEGLRLPDGLRWSGGFEEEATADLESAGFSKDAILSVRPYLSPQTRQDADPTASMGWVFITQHGAPLTRDDGSLVIYRPTPAAQREAERIHRMLDEGEASFDNSRFMESEGRAFGEAVGSRMGRWMARNVETAPVTISDPEKFERMTGQRAPASLIPE